MATNGTGIGIALCRLALALGLCGIGMAEADEAQAIDLAEIRNLVALKAGLYEGITSSHAQGVAAGTAQADPGRKDGGAPQATLWLHFRVRDDRLDALAAAIPRPGTLSLVKVPITRGESPQ